MLATSLVRREGSQSDAALKALEQALAKNPKHYWAYQQRGARRLERGEPALAAADFGAVIGLWPDYALGYFNLGCALLRAGQAKEAEAQFTLALERDDTFVLAWLNRGLVRLEARAHALALDDFTRAIDLGCELAAAPAGRGVAL